MKIHSQPVMRIAAVLALVAASTSAFAQNGDFRRGYDDGYAAGQRAAYDDHGPRWPRVHIEDAAYGAHGSMCDARRAVWHEVERRGAVHVGNELCGDPAHGAVKHLRIVYRCGDSAPMRVVGRENETLRLGCRR
jgi:hypothetical protein